MSGIPVDVSAENAVAARREALLQGQQSGLGRLLRRLVPATERGRLPDPSSVPVERYVQNFEIADEQLSETRYIARLTVGFDPKQVRDLLQSERLPFAQVPSAPLVVLPLYEVPQGAQLWPENNPWWAAWAEQLDRERLLRMIMPLGDLQDISSLTVDQARAGDRLALQTVAGRYGAQDAVVMTAEPLTPVGSEVLSGGTIALPITVRLGARRVGPIEQENPPFEFTGAPGQPLEEVLKVAARRLQDSLDEEWKSANLLRLDQGGLMFVDIPITDLPGWVEINRNLESLPEVSQVDVRTFARERVQAQIYYVGELSGFERALDGLGLTLSREGDSWLLHPKGANLGFEELPNETQTSF